MKKLLASAATIIALIALPIETGSAYPGGGGRGGHSSGGGNLGGGNFGSNGNHAGNNSGNKAFNSLGNGNSHPSNSNGHPNAKNHSVNPNTSSNNHSNTKNSNGHNNNSNNNSGHYHYTHQHGHPWDTKEWNHAWYRHWYHGQFIFWNGGWVWWDPDVLRWVPYVEGQYIPEDYYVQGQDPPAAGGVAIRIVNPTDTQTTINYSINDNDYQIAPGSEQDLTADQQWVISFDRGENDGTAQYTLAPGVYTFGPSDHGWELYHTSDTVDN